MTSGSSYFRSISLFFHLKKKGQIELSFPLFSVFSFSACNSDFFCGISCIIYISFEFSVFVDALWCHRSSGVSFFLLISPRIFRPRGKSENSRDLFCPGVGVLVLPPPSIPHPTATPGSKTRPPHAHTPICGSYIAANCVHVKFSRYFPHVRPFINKEI